MKSRHCLMSVYAYVILCFVVFSVPVLAQPFAYVTHEESNDVWVIDTHTDEVVAKVPVGDRPRGVVVSADGSRVYAANGNSNDISVIDAATNAVVETFPVGIDPEGIDLSNDEKLLFVVNENEGVMRVVDLASKEIVATIPVSYTHLTLPTKRIV